MNKDREESDGYCGKGNSLLVVEQNRSATSTDNNGNDNKKNSLLCTGSGANHDDDDAPPTANPPVSVIAYCDHDDQTHASSITTAHFRDAELYASSLYPSISRVVRETDAEEHHHHHQQQQQQHGVLPPGPRSTTTTTTTATTMVSSSSPPKSLQTIEENLLRGEKASERILLTAAKVEGTGGSAIITKEDQQITSRQRQQSPTKKPLPRRVSYISYLDEDIKAQQGQHQQQQPGAYYAAVIPVPSPHSILPEMFEDDIIREEEEEEEDQDTLMDIVAKRAAGHYDRNDDSGVSVVNNSGQKNLQDDDDPTTMNSPSPQPPATTTLTRNPQVVLNHFRQQQPGAFAAAPGMDLCRIDLVTHNTATTTFYDDNDRGEGKDDISSESTGPSSSIGARCGGGCGGVVNNNCDDDTIDDDNNNSLVEALPVDEEEDYTHHCEIDAMEAAQPVHEDSLLEVSQQRQATREAKEKKYKRIACGIVGVAGLFLLVSLAVWLIRKHNKSNNNDLSDDDQMPSLSGQNGLSLPPMTENLQLLYENLPNSTKESLANNQSPQYQAWDWLLHHPNVATYPEWRKEQIFAMATFYYSFEGPNWPEGTPARDRWMDYAKSECSWVMTTFESLYWYKQSEALVGPDAYTKEDYKPCNPKGEIQTFALNHLFLPTTSTPTIPPQIGLLTSIKLFGMGFGQIGDTKFADLFPTELLQLPNLQGITLRSNGYHGTIPTILGTMTQLKHLLVGANALTGTIPSQIATMSSLELLNIGDESGIVGGLPTELGLMTGLTGLEIYRCSVSGMIPTELGSLSRLETLYLDGNTLSGTIPSQLGSLTANTWLALYGNSFTGTLPTELGLLTNAIRLRIWNNAFTGFIPSELGLMTDATEISLGNDLMQKGAHNDFVGSIPSELWELSHLEKLFLPNLPNLRGKIPSQILMPNLTTFSLGGSPRISGKIPDQVCIFVEELDFYCSDVLCGCDCRCPGGTTNKTNLD